MNLRGISAVFTIAAFGLPMMTFDALGQKPALKEQLVGTWTLLSWEQKKGDGGKLEGYGTSPKGIAFFDAGGRYIITVMRPDRAKYASNALWQGTSDELARGAQCATRVQFQLLSQQLGCQTVGRIKCLPIDNEDPEAFVPRYLSVDLLAPTAHAAPPPPP